MKGLYFATLVLLSCSFAYGDDDFMANWMGRLMPAIGEQTLLDIAVPGTHDSNTWDLSTTVSDSAEASIPDWLTELLHDIYWIPGIGAWIRDQAKTQGLNTTGQLDNGVRFIDFRLMKTRGPDSFKPVDGWYSLHFVESNNLALTYLGMVKAWLDAHPTEIVTLWLSRHGSECDTGNEQYGQTTVAERQAVWNNITLLFGDLLVNHAQNPINETSIAKLVKLNQRVVIYATDYVNFTSSSPLALDACLIDNDTGPGEDEEVSAAARELNIFSTAAVTKAQLKPQNKYYLMSMAGAQPGKAMEYSFFLKFLPFDTRANDKACAALFNITGLVDWCPLHLQDCSQLRNYYGQLTLDYALTHDLDFPNAIYLGAVDQQGTIRTGSAVFGDSSSVTINGNINATVITDDSIAALVTDTTDARFAYADTLLLYNVRRACKKLSPTPPECESLDAMLVTRRAANPVTVWNDPTHGRLVGWPTLP